MRAILLLIFSGTFAVGAPLKIMTWNLHHGVGEDGKLNLERIAKRIAAEKPDLVALQEIDRNCARSGMKDQAAELGRLTGMTAVFGKAMDLGGGEYGQAALSNLPVISSAVHRLTSIGEPRIALELNVKWNGGALKFTTIHLDYEHEPVRIGQVREALEALAGGGPAILCGDFNDVPGSAAVRQIAAPWLAVGKEGPAATHPSAKPDTEIDQIFVRGLKVVAKGRVLDEKIASDHRPVVAAVAAE
jgi:endonuclease/exonuclease/phosphatase family metal-dependent hydrolase